MIRGLGVFLEIHEEPTRAKSDAQNALRLNALQPLLQKLVQLDAIARELAIAAVPTTVNA
jgi:3-deoxy-D-manno-octulosonic acid (KDO) 8-phosphate synthase